MIRGIIIGAGGIYLFIAMLSVPIIYDSIKAKNWDWIYFMIMGLMASVIFMMELDALFSNPKKPKERQV